MLTGKNWASIVKDKSKDVLVFYHASWCQKCEIYDKKWSQFAEEVKDVKNLVIGRYDAMANEVEGLKILGFPSIFYYPKEDKLGVDVTIQREKDDLLKLLRETSSVYRAARPNEYHTEL